MTKQNGRVVLQVSTQSGEQQVQAEKVLLAAGVQPNSDNIGLEAAGVATERGVITVESIAGLETRALNYKDMPRATYCHPQVASMGLTEAEARSDGREIKV